MIKTLSIMPMNLRRILWLMITLSPMFMLMIRMFWKAKKRNVKLITAFLSFFKKMFKLQSNLLGLEHFSDGKVQIVLLQFLQGLNCPIKPLTLVLMGGQVKSDYSYVPGELSTIIRNLNKRCNIN